MLIKEIMIFGKSYHISRDSVVGEVTESIVTKCVVDLFRCFQQRFVTYRDRFFLVRFCNTFYIYCWNPELLTIHVWRGKGGSEYGRGDATQSGESENKNMCTQAGNQVKPRTHRCADPTIVLENFNKNKRKR